MDRVGSEMGTEVETLWAIFFLLCVNTRIILEYTWSLMIVILIRKYEYTSILVMNIVFAHLAIFFLLPSNFNNVA